MSSMIRRIERTIDRARTKGGHLYLHPRGWGSKLGVRNPKAKDLLARAARDVSWGRACKPAKQDAG